MNVEELIQQAKLLLGENKLEEAKTVFENILEIEPSHYKTHTNIGAILLKLEKFKEAMKSFEKAVELNPNFVIAHYNLGITQTKLNMMDEAEASYKKAIEFKIDYVEAYINLGSILLKMNKLTEAEKSFKNALEYQPQFAVAHYNLGCTQEKMNKFDDARSSYEKAIKFKSDYYDAHNNLNRMLKQNKFLLDLKKVREAKISNQDIQVGLSANPFLSKREVESELITEIYKINSIEIDNTKDIRFGNGRFSDYELFENNSSIIKRVEKELTQIITQAIKSNIFIIDSFFNILRTGSGLASHHHINNFDRKHNLGNQKFSLTYYLTVGDQNCSDPGILKLYDPDEEILPSEGTIVIFPANRLHSASYGGKTDRVMIGVNFYSLS